MSTEEPTSYQSPAQLEAERGLGRHAALPAFFAVLVVAFVLAVAAGLFSVSLWIAVLGVVIAIGLLFFAFWRRRMYLHLLPPVAEEQYYRHGFPMWRRMVVASLEQPILLGILTLFFALLAYWANNQSPVVSSAYPNVTGSAVQTIGAKLDLLTQAVGKLAPGSAGQPQGSAPMPQAGVDLSGLQGAIDGLGRRMDNLADRLGPAGGIRVAPQPQQLPEEPQRLEGRLSVEWPRWTVFMALLLLPVLVIVTFVGAALTANSATARRRVVIAAVSATVLSSAPAMLSLVGKIDVKSLFTCENCALKFGLGSPPTALRQLAPSPSFDVGATLSAQKTVGCIDPQKSAREWNEWFTARARDWINRPIRTESDTLMVVGSADRQPLRGPLGRHFGSNDGLARARAEAVKEGLQDAIKGQRKGASDVLAENRIIVLTTGPANTPEVTPRLGRNTSACDQRLAEDRRVRLWINAATPK